MREVVFRVDPAGAGPLRATAEQLPLTIEAPSLEELQHEAREALIEHFGAAHVSIRVRIRHGGRGGAAAHRAGQRPLIPKSTRELRAAAATAASVRTAQPPLQPCT